MSEKPLVLVDIDNTLIRQGVSMHPANARAWDGILREKPATPIAAARRALGRVQELADLALLTSRPEHVRALTLQQLRRSFPWASKVDAHFCPVGLDGVTHKLRVRARYIARGRTVYAIDDVKWHSSVLEPPRGWAVLLQRLEAGRG